jgi:4-hydroxy-2-oxoheptanedioate aldolase
MRPNRVKRALRDGQVQIGTWINAVRTPQITQVLAAAGFDFVYIDMEHSAFSIETVGDLCTAALGAGLVPIVRPPAKEPHLLSRPLDSGAMGLLIPHVDTREEAEAVVRAIRFPPAGARGMAGQGVHTGFARIPAEANIRSTHEETLLLVQIESDRGIRDLDGILTIDGIDGAVIGRGDLAADLGVPGQIDHLEVSRRVEMLIAACRRHGRIPGLLVHDVASARTWIDRGIRLVPFSSEVALLLDAGERAIAAIRRP